MDARTAPLAGRTQEGWLVLIGVGAVLLIGVPLASWSGGLLALAGLLWSRWFRPFGRAGFIGYVLCWLSITFVPLALFVYERQSRYFHVEGLWELGIYLLCAGIWLVFCRKFISQPSRTVGRAFLVGLAGSLFLAPGVMAAGQVVLMLPVIACILLNAAGWLMGGAVLPPLIALLGAAMALPVLLGHLAVYWPSRSGSGGYA